MFGRSVIRTSKSFKNTTKFLSQHHQHQQSRFQNKRFSTSSFENSKQTNSRSGLKIALTIGIVGIGIYQITDHLIFAAEDSKSQNKNNNNQNSKQEKTTGISFPLIVRYGDQNFDIVGEPSVKTGNLFFEK